MKTLSGILSAALVLTGCGNVSKFGPLEVTGNLDQPEAGQQISVTTWNVGYGALGAGADFVADGGTSFRALDVGEIRTAVAEIAREVDGFDSQFVLLQELANDSYLTRNTPVRAEIERNLTDYSAVYWEDLGVHAAPRSLRVSHGMGVYALNDVEVSKAYELPQPDGYTFLRVKRYYAAIVSEVPIRDSDRKWVVINVHLSAFDEGADVRRAQIKALFDFAESEYRKGNYVVLGGDWNMRIADTEFPHTTAEEHLFWLYDFPPKMLPAGWRFGVDRATPTVRTLHKPYVKGENYTTIIDGFAYSPNVNLRHVSTTDLEFAHSDHHPVTAVFSTR